MCHAHEEKKHLIITSKFYLQDFPPRGPEPVPRKRIGHGARNKAQPSSLFTTAFEA